MFIFKVFTLSVLASRSDSLNSFNSQLISDISRLIEQSVDDKQTLDESCGALARLSLSPNITRLENEQIIHRIFTQLTPLRTDFSQYHSILSLVVLKCQCQLPTTYFPRILSISAHFLSIDDEFDDQNDHEQSQLFEVYRDETKQLAILFIKWLNQNLSTSDFEIALKQLNPKYHDFIRQIL